MLWIYWAFWTHTPFRGKQNISVYNTLAENLDQESWDGCHTSGGSLYSWLILLRLIPEIYKRTSEDVLTFSWLIQAILDPLLPEVLLWSTPTLCYWKNSHKAPKQNIWKWITEGVFVLFSENRGWSVCSFYPPLPILLPQPQKVEKWKICKSSVRNQGKLICISPEPKECHLSPEPVRSRGSLVAPLSTALSHCWWKWRNQNWGVGRE